MGWRIEFDKRVEKDLRALDRKAAARVLNYLHARVAPLNDPRQVGKALSGELADLWRYRVGPYRIIATIDDDRVRILVVRVARRSKAYR